MLNAYYLKKVAVNVKKIFVIKVAKCKESSILTAIQNTVHFAKKQHMKMVQVIDQ
jgi:hypothetical protein